MPKSVVGETIEDIEAIIKEKSSELDARIKSIDKDVTLGTPVVVEWEKIREFNGITKMADHNLDNGALNILEDTFRDRARDEQNPIKKSFTRRLLTFVC